PMKNTDPKASPESTPGVGSSDLVRLQFSRNLVGENLRSTAMTSENSTERLSGVNLKHRFLSVLVAVGAKPMRRLIGCLRWIERVHKGSVTNLPKRVTGALLLPFVVCCKLSLECYYALGFLLIESLNTHCLSVEIKQH